MQHWWVTENVPPHAGLSSPHAHQMHVGLVMYTTAFGSGARLSATSATCQPQVRVTFNLGPSYEPNQRFPNAIFLKELSFRWARNRLGGASLGCLVCMRRACSRSGGDTGRKYASPQRRLLPHRGVVVCCDRIVLLHAIC